MDKIITSHPAGVSELIYDRYSCVISFGVAVKVGTHNPSGVRESPLRTLSASKANVLSRADRESEPVIRFHVEYHKLDLAQQIYEEDARSIALTSCMLNSSQSDEWPAQFITLLCPD